jgi:hypothetical protein
MCLSVFKKIIDVYCEELNQKNTNIPRAWNFGLWHNTDSRVVVFWAVTPSSLIGCCQRFAGTCSHLRIFAKRPAHLILFDLIVRKILGKEWKHWELSLHQRLDPRVTCSSSVLCSQTSATVCVLLLQWETKFNTHTKQQVTLLLYVSYFNR